MGDCRYFVRWDCWHPEVAAPFGWALWVQPDPSSIELVYLLQITHPIPTLLWRNNGEAWAISHLSHDFPLLDATDTTGNDTFLGSFTTEIPEVLAERILVLFDL